MRAETKSVAPGKKRNTAKHMYFGAIEKRDKMTKDVV